MALLKQFNSLFKNSVMIAYPCSELSPSTFFVSVEMTSSWRGSSAIMFSCKSAKFQA